MLTVLCFCSLWLKGMSGESDVAGAAAIAATAACCLGGQV
jgi:hypothetical protein